MNEPNPTGERSDGSSPFTWTEYDLPQRERTKGAHGLHPYPGKYPPQLVEALIGRYFEPGSTILDPFSGCGTTLLVANAFGAHSVGYDTSALACLIGRVRTTSYDLEALQARLNDALERSAQTHDLPASTSSWLRTWYSNRALRELLAYREAITALDEPFDDVARLILSSSARSARRVPHHQLGDLTSPVCGPYDCKKHKKVCVPTSEARKFLVWRTRESIERLRAAAAVRTSCPITVVNEDVRTASLPPVAGVITSPPYPGRLDYHEQHRYAYELLDLPDHSQDEIGSAGRGTSRAALASYREAMAAAFSHIHTVLPAGAPVIVVVEDRRDLFPPLLADAGLRLEDRMRRRVDRRTGLRSSDFHENILVCVAN